jgi:RNA polymerase-binding transcription factor DksA
VDTDVARQRLEAERARLESLREELRIRESETEELGELSSVDSPAELGTETFERELRVTTLTMVEEELREVDDALRRLADGTYGMCEACGRPIEEARLQAKPAARFCVEDQARLERELHPINRAP